MWRRAEQKLLNPDKAYVPIPTECDVGIGYLHVLPYALTYALTPSFSRGMSSTRLHGR